MSIIDMLKKLPGIARGVLGALTFLGTAPAIIPYSVLEIVSLVHSLILGWNTIVSNIWQIFEDAFNVPDLEPQLINTIIFGLSITSTWSFSVLKNEWGHHKGFIQNVAFYVRIVISVLEGPILALIVLNTNSSFFFWACLALLIMMIVSSLRSLPNFRIGFLTILGFVGFLEGIYLISTDDLRNRYDAFVCEYQEVNLPQCTATELP